MTKSHSHWNKNTEQNINFWNALSHRMRSKDTNMDSNHLLEDVAKLAPYHKDMRILDIGCGAGRYAIHLSPLVREVVAQDIAPKMIEAAKEDSKGLENIHFMVGDFMDPKFSPENLGTFDVAIAPMTPAISDIPSLERMIALGRVCGLSKHTRRKYPHMEYLCDHFGAIHKESSASFKLIFDHLWSLGIKPFLTHHREIWEREYDPETLTEETFLRLKQEVDLVDEDKAFIRSYYEDQAEDGKVMDWSDVTISVLTWENLQ
ncbi:MAG: class I SAM-dependent methyltransferase [Tissierellia bacterium]|nr:class I SAM-dependent methyltransferase [Tissierellia bacterium]